MITEDERVAAHICQCNAAGYHAAVVRTLAMPTWSGRARWLSYRDALTMQAQRAQWALRARQHMGVE